MDIGQEHVANFGDSATGRVHQLENRAVPFPQGITGLWGIEKAIDLRDAQDEGNPLPHLGCCEQFRRVVDDGGLQLKKLKEHSQGNDMPRDG